MKKILFLRINLKKLWKEKILSAKQKVTSVMHISSSRSLNNPISRPISYMNIVEFQKSQHKEEQISEVYLN